MLIFYQSFPFSPSASCSRSRCWYRRIVVEVVFVGVSLSSLFFVVGIGVPSCFCVHWLLHLVAGGVLSLLSSAASPPLKITYPFVHKFQQFIGKNIKLFERVCEIFFSQHVSGLSNRCTFALANGLDGWFIYRF